ncbi:hypothetical protein J6590_020705 [Homalodisca vitripennis]|nr:hypothetical protein J6590_020705 [Homalodisca vitripennis]
MRHTLRPISSQKFEVMVVWCAHCVIVLLRMRVHWRDEQCLSRVQTKVTATAAVTPFFNYRRTQDLRNFLPVSPALSVMPIPATNFLISTVGDSHIELGDGHVTWLCAILHAYIEQVPSTSSFSDATVNTLQLTVCSSHFHWCFPPRGREHDFLPTTSLCHLGPSHY